MELKPTWNEASKVWWSFFWRYLITIILSAVPIIIALPVFTFLISSLGASTELVTALTLPLFLWLIPLFLSIVPLKMILNKDFGDFRLVLVRGKAGGYTGGGAGGDAGGYTVGEAGGNTGGEAKKEAGKATGGDADGDILGSTGGDFTVDFDIDGGGD